jgi:hypothetical protein
MEPSWAQTQEAKKRAASAKEMRFRAKVTVTSRAAQPRAPVTARAQGAAETYLKLFEL